MRTLARGVNMIHEREGTIKSRYIVNNGQGKKVGDGCFVDPPPKKKQEKKVK